MIIRECLTKKEIKSIVEGIEYPKQITIGTHHTCPFCGERGMMNELQDDVRTYIYHVLNHFRVEKI